MRVAGEEHREGARNHVQHRAGGAVGEAGLAVEVPVQLLHGAHGDDLPRIQRNLQVEVLQVALVEVGLRHQRRDVDVHPGQIAVDLVAARRKRVQLVGQREVDQLVEACADALVLGQAVQRVKNHFSSSFPLDSSFK